MIYTSRSAIERLERCPRARYYEYHTGGIGLVKSGVNLDIEIGTAVHNGLGRLLTEQMKGVFDKIPSEQWESVTEPCIYGALADFDTRLNELGAFVSEDEAWVYQLEEAKAIVEAFVRAWAIVGLPSFVERFKVLAVEREDVYPLVPGKVMLGGRVDSIVQSKTDLEEIDLISWKTVKKYDERVEKAASHDNQGISESIITEHQMMEHNRAVNMLVNSMRGAIETASTVLGDTNVSTDLVRKAFELAYGLKKELWPSTQVNAVIMGYFLKGDKSEDSKCQDYRRYIYGTPLIRGYRKWNEAIKEWEYAWNFTPPSDTTKSGKTRLGKGWERFDTWSELEGGVKTWINMLAEEDDNGRPVVQPECGWCLPQQYVEVEFNRNQRDMDSWLRQKGAEELRTYVSLMLLAETEAGEFEDVLDIRFPQHRNSCHYPSDCPYIPACFDPEVHEAMAAATDDTGQLLYQIRVPHHEPERKALATQFAQDLGAEPDTDDEVPF